MKENFNNILLINFGGLGDEILFLPTIESIKKTYLNCKITLALEPRSESIVSLSNLIDDVIKLNIKGKNKYLELLKLIFICYQKNFDAVFSTGSNKFIPVLLFLSGIKYRFGFNNGFLSKLLLTKTVFLNKNQYASNMYHDLVSCVSNCKCSLPKIYLKQENILLEKNSVLIHPGVSSMSLEKNIIKSLDAEKWVKLINKLLNKEKKVYLCGGPDDQKIINEITKEIDNKQSNFINMFGKTKNILNLIELMSKVETVICPDSAPMHISVALNKKTIAIFGPTDEKKLIPNSEKFINITNKNCNCRPCLWDKRSTSCEDLNCLDINIDDIIKYI